MADTPKLIAMMWVVEEGNGPRAFDSFLVVLDLDSQGRLLNPSPSKLAEAAQNGVDAITARLKREGKWPAT